MQICCMSNISIQLRIRCRLVQFRPWPKTTTTQPNREREIRKKTRERLTFFSGWLLPFTVATDVQSTQPWHWAGWATVQSHNPDGRYPLSLKKSSKKGLFAFDVTERNRKKIKHPWESRMLDMRTQQVCFRFSPFSWVLDFCFWLQCVHSKQQPFSTTTLDR